MAEHDVEQVWAEFWTPALDQAVEGLPLGKSVAIPGVYYDQIKRELFDYHRLLKKLPVFFCDITNGKVSKPNTDLSVVAEIVQEEIRDQVAELLAEEKEYLAEDARDEAWQKGYDEGWNDGHERGVEAGLEEARNRI